MNQEQIWSKSTRFWRHAETEDSNKYDERYKRGCAEGRDVHRCLDGVQGRTAGRRCVYQRAAVGPGAASKTVKVGRRRLERVLISLSISGS